MLAARVGDRVRFSVSGALALALVAPLIVLMANAAQLAEFIRLQVMWKCIPGFWRLNQAQSFPTDYIIAGLIMLHFLAIRWLCAAGRLGWLLSCRRPIRCAAGFTFSLYLYHVPLIHLARDFMHLEQRTGVELSVVVLGILGIVVMLGSITEQQKAPWQRLFTRLLQARGRVDTSPN